MCRATVKRAAVSLALVMIALLSVLEQRPAQADGYCDPDLYIDCGGPVFLQTTPEPGAVNLYWSFGLDQPSEVVISRGTDSSFLSEIDRQQVSGDVETDSAAPTFYRDTQVATGQGYIYQTCFFYPSPGGLATGCRQSPSSPVPPASNTNPSGPTASAGSSNGGSAPSTPGNPSPMTPQGNPPSNVHVEARANIAVFIAWTPPADDWTAVQVTCQPAAPGDTCPLSEDDGGAYLSDSHQASGLFYRGDGTSILFENLQSGHTYTFTACTLYSVVKAGTCAAPLTVRMLAAPADLQITAHDAQHVTLTWTDPFIPDDHLGGGPTRNPLTVVHPPAAEFAIYRDGVQVGSQQAGGGVGIDVESLGLNNPGYSYTDTFAVDPSHTYTYQVCAETASSQEQSGVTESDTYKAPCSQPAQLYGVAVPIQNPAGIPMCVILAGQPRC